MIKEKLLRVVVWVRRFIRENFRNNNEELPYYITILISAVLFIIALNGFVELTDDLAENDLKELDNQVTSTIVSFRSDALTAYFRVATDLGDRIGLAEPGQHDERNQQQDVQQPLEAVHAHFRAMRGRAMRAQARSRDAAQAAQAHEPGDGGLPARAAPARVRQRWSSALGGLAAGHSHQHPFHRTHAGTGPMGERRPRHAG